MYIYKDYFKTWMENLQQSGEIEEPQLTKYNELRQWYKKADEGFNARFLSQPNKNSEGDSKNKNNTKNKVKNSTNDKSQDETKETPKINMKDILKDFLYEHFEKNLNMLNENWATYQEDNTLNKLAHLTKGNILLTEGQCIGEHFYDDPQKYYHQACVILEHRYDPENYDFLDLMIQLNLGKYFRNMGKHNHRSDYLRAQDEFEKVKAKINNNSKDKFEPWETHIWLESEINIGWTERYLYHLNEAKICFLNMLKLLSSISGKNISINENIDKYLQSEEYCVESKTDTKQENYYDVLKNKLNGDKELYEDYIIQTLVQLGIAYQKSRDYDIAIDICIAILKEDSDNIDAANNLAVCLRKQEIKNSLASETKLKRPYAFNKADIPKSKYFTMSYEEIFSELAGTQNRFAKLHKIRCDMDKKQPNNEEIKIQIKELLSGNPNDQEVRLLKGLFLQKLGDFVKSQKIFEKLYNESAHISKGTIGLKAYYNIAANLLSQKNFREAIKYYEKIEEECKRTDNRDSQNRKQYNISNDAMLLDNLPRGDLLAEIDKGWCLMNLGNYRNAKVCYEKILANYKKTPHRLRKQNDMKIHNNLGECYLHLVKDANSEEDKKKLESAYKNLNYVYDNEKYNATTHWHLGHYHKLNSINNPNPYDELELALEHFKNAELYKKDDIFFHAGWVSAIVPPLLEDDSSPIQGKKDKLIQSLENRLKYSSDIYSMKACAKLAAFIKMLETEYKRKYEEDPDNIDKEKDKDRLKTMYRSLARIRLRKSEEGYGLFQRFMENDTFRRLEAAKRGEILVALFRLYEQIIKIKALCRYRIRINKKDTYPRPVHYTKIDTIKIKALCRYRIKINKKDTYPRPVHYTKIDTLKKILPDNQKNSGKLRLWNTVYMNDSFEGSCFIDMLAQVGKKELKNKEFVDAKMKIYFPFLDKQPSKEDDELLPSNENIYVCSFSEQTNEIHMWVPYADDAKGCAITFADDFFDIRKTEDSLTDVSSYSDDDYPLYKIQYLDEDKWKNWIRQDTTETINFFKRNHNQIGNILEIMKEIWNILDELDDRMDNNNIFISDSNAINANEKDFIQNFVSKCLNEVRFLIKSSEYSFEKEVRMLHYSHEPKIDVENFAVPRLYVEVNRDIQIKEIKLGSKVNDSQANEIVSWLTKTGKVQRITKSKRHYK